MMENDDILIRQFLEENKQEISDRGFSQRVMRRLPSRASRLNRIWTLVCVVAGMVFFVSVKGWSILANTIGELLKLPSQQELFHLSPQVIIVSLLVLSTLAVGQVVASETT